MERLTEDYDVINISWNSKNETESKLSNLAFSPFVMDSMYYASVEWFWQWLKFDDESKRREIAKMFWYKSKYWINFDDMSKNNFFTYRWLRYEVWWQEHQLLMKKAIRCKLEQNPEILKLLIETWDKKLIHSPKKKDWTLYPDSITIPAEIFCRFYTELRKEFFDAIESGEAHFLFSLVKDIRWKTQIK